MRRTFGSAQLTAVWTTLSALVLLPSLASAQEAEAQEPAAAEAETGAEEATDAEGAADAQPESEAVEGEAEKPAEPAEPEEVEAPAPEPTEPEAADPLVEKVSALEAEVAALKTAQEEAEMAALMGDEEVQVQPETFKLYGFMDVGLQRFFAPNDGAAASFNGNALTFVLGNLNIYFDFNPHPDWRGLAEVRFTMAPLGEIESYGGVDFLTNEETTFQRTSTQQFDPHATAANTPMWRASTVIERAWIEWKRFQQFQLRAGHFFTPFGIWNVDHGQPTLIAARTPQFIQQMYAPTRQTGLQALGSFFAGEWEIAYRAWLTNGRNEISIQDLNDDKAFGLRAFVRRDAGKVNLQVGASYHHGRVADRAWDTAFDFATFTATWDEYETFAYLEDVVGADVSLDVGEFRLRSEFTSQTRRWEDGKRMQGFNGFEPDGTRYSVYGLMAYQLPFLGLEPYLAGEFMKYPQGATNRLVEIAPGFNVRFNPQAVLKTQVTYTKFFNWSEKGAESIFGNFTSWVTRLVLAF